MRLGLVCLLIAFLAAGDAAAQWQDPGATNGFAVPMDRSIVRADGTTIGVDVPQPRRENVQGAISFRHYVHRPAKKAREYFAKAIKSLESNNENEALGRLTDAVRVDPDYFEAQAQLGMLYLENERHAEALPYLERALAIDPSSQIVQGLAAWSLLKLGKFSEAETAARRALQLGRSIPILEEVIRVARLNRAALAQMASAARSTP